MPDELPLTAASVRLRRKPGRPRKAQSASVTGVAHPGTPQINSSNSSAEASQTSAPPLPGHDRCAFPTALCPNCARVCLTSGRRRPTSACRPIPWTRGGRKPKGGHKRTSIPGTFPMTPPRVRASASVRLASCVRPGGLARLGDGGPEVILLHTHASARKPPGSASPVVGGATL